MEETHIIYAAHTGDYNYRYVGKTSRTLKYRVSVHRSNARKRRTKMPVHAWLRKHHLRVQWDVLEACTPETLDSRECFWIATLREQGHDLLNCTEGGEGMGGWQHSEAFKAARRGAGNPMYGRKRDDFRANRAEGRIGMHVRWHVNRGLDNPSCVYCPKS